MITTNVYNLENDTNYQGLSTDEKPKYGVPQNSIFFELDTKNIYYCLTVGVKKPYREFLPETTFTAEQDETYYQYDLGNVEVSGEAITVVFDGVSFDVKRKDIWYGAPYNDGTETYDFSKIPFAISSAKSSMLDIWRTYIFVGDDDEHTIEIHTNGIPAVWAKSGEKQLGLFFEQTIQANSFNKQTNNWYYSPSYPISKCPEKVIVEYDGDEYECTRQTEAEFNSHYYGAPLDGDSLDYSEYPFKVWYGEDGDDSFAGFNVPTKEAHTFKIYG